MKKTLVLEVDRQSWSSVRAALRKSCPFPASKKTAAIDFNAALLWMGRMSVPLKRPQWGLASKWAKVRYYAAADTATPLRLHTAIDELDTHQKKVLSDDFFSGPDFWPLGGALVAPSKFRLARVIQTELVCHTPDFSPGLIRPMSGLATILH